MGSHLHGVALALTACLRNATSCTISLTRYRMTKSSGCSLRCAGGFPENSAAWPPAFFGMGVDKEGRTHLPEHVDEILATDPDEIEAQRQRDRRETR